MQGFVARKALEAISPYVAGKPIEETARQYGGDAGGHERHTLSGRSGAGCA